MADVVQRDLTLGDRGAKARSHVGSAATARGIHEVDATIPIGTVMPGVLIAGDYEGDRADLRGTARWKDGHWHLETMRALRTGSKFDHDFVPGHDLYMWVNYAVKDDRIERLPVKVGVRDSGRVEVSKGCLAALFIAPPRSRTAPIRLYISVRERYSRRDLGDRHR